MKIGSIEVCYIPPVRKSTDYSLVPGVMLGAAAVTTDKPWVQEQIEAAINSSIIQPFQTWMLDTWCSFVDVSFVMCLAIAFTGSICALLGIEKGKKAAVLSIVFFFMLKLFSWAMGWY